MTQPAYPAARAVAATIEAHFAKHLTRARDEGEIPLAQAPDAEVVEAIIDAAFWASLRREEDRMPRISLAYLSPEQAEQPLKLAKPIPLGARALTRLAPAVERPGIHLGIWRSKDGLEVWGATRTIPGYCFVLEVAEPGLLVVKHRRADEFGKFANVAVLEGEQVKVVDEEGASLPDCPGLITSLLGFTAATRDESANVLVQLAISMRGHRRGGSLLVVPDGSEEWRESIVQPMSYPVEPAFDGLSALMKDRQEHDRGWQDAMRRAIDAIAGLTAVDGATIINQSYELLAFGAKIERRPGGTTVERVATTEPIVGSEPAVVTPGLLGGTRHLSAAQFVSDQHDSLALIASQDGRFTVFAWSPCEAMVHAHSVEALLL